MEERRKETTEEGVTIQDYWEIIYTRERYLSLQKISFCKQHKADAVGNMTLHPGQLESPSYKNTHLLYGSTILNTLEHLAEDTISFISFKPLEPSVIGNI